MPFDLKAYLNLDGTGFDRTLKAAPGKAKQAASEIKSSMSGLGDVFAASLGGLAAGGALGGIVGWFKAQADHVTQIAAETKVGSNLLNVDPETFQRVNNVMKLTEGSTEQVAHAMLLVAENQQKIKEGAPEAEKLAAAYSKLGVTLSDIKNSEYQSVFFQIARALKDATMDGEKLGALREALGKTGPALLPAFRVGFDSQMANAGIIPPEVLEGFEDRKKERLEMESYADQGEMQAGVWGKRVWDWVTSRSRAMIAGPVKLGEWLGYAAWKHRSAGEEVESGMAEARWKLENTKLNDRRAEGKRAQDAEDLAAMQKQQAYDKEQKRLDPIVEQKRKRFNEQAEAERVSEMGPEEKRGYYENQMVEANAAVAEKQRVSEANPDDLKKQNELLDALAARTAAEKAYAEVIRELAAKENAAALAGKTVKEKLAYYRERLAQAARQEAEQTEWLESHPDDAKAREYEIQARWGRKDAEAQLAALTNQEENRGTKAMAADSLAKMGVFAGPSFRSSDSILERTARAAEELVRQGRDPRVAPGAIW